MLTGTSKTISGTASDGSGFGSTVGAGSHRRSDGQYWTGSGWRGTEQWRSATGTTNWTYAWSLDAGQNGALHLHDHRTRDRRRRPHRADATPVTGVKVDNVAPTNRVGERARPYDCRRRLERSAAASSISASDFTIAGLDRDRRNRCSRTTSPCGSPRPRKGRVRATQCNAALASVLDLLAGNGNGSTNAVFSGWEPGPDATAPSVPAGVEVASGTTSPTIATVSWAPSSDNDGGSGMKGYRVWRAVVPAGPFLPIGMTATLSFADNDGVPGQDYYYTVSAYDQMDNESAQSAPAAGPVHAGWTSEPHGGYGPSTRYCEFCHVPHSAPASGIMRETGATSAGQVAVCLACHDGSGAATNIATGPVDSFSLASGHTLEETPASPDLSDSCDSCHSTHRSRAEYPQLPAKSVNSVEVTSTTVDNSWCLACHNAADDWYGAGYPSASNPTRNAAGYPISGTFPGPSVYGDQAKNAHAGIPASSAADRPAASCLYCHSAHRGSNDYDGLALGFRPSSAGTVSQDQSQGTYAESCFYCHGGTVPSEFTTAPANIKQFATAGDEGSGHRIKTAGGNLPVGAPLPCYDCHGPHGSTRGNASLISDELGQNLGTDSASGVRHFCLTCHATGGGDVWNSTTSAYNAVTGSQLVEGLHRDGSDGSVLRLPSRYGHATSDTTSCNVCHGGSYGAGDNNVHNPSAGGESPGGEDCFLCHSYESMQSSSSYHHYMSSADATPYATITDPADLTQSDARRTCLICHVDHDFFSPDLNTDPAHTDGRAQNLRSNIGTTPVKSDGSTYVNRDQDQGTVGTGGVCVSCHRVRMEKNSTGRKSSPDSTQTVSVTGDVYYYSAHNYYAATATFTTDSSSFDVNCAKCHNDSMTKSFQAGPFEFGTHDSARTAILTDGGQAGFNEDPQEQLCWLCHSRSSETVGPYNPNGGSTYAGTATDLYGSGIDGAMATSALNIKGLFTNAAIVSRHPITGDGSTTSRVECANCHNSHKSRPSSVLTSDGTAQDPDNTLRGGGVTPGDTVAYYSDASGATELAANRDYCLACHDGTPPAKVNDGNSYVPSDVFIAGAAETSADKTRYAGRSHFNISAGETSASAQTIATQCSTCHDKHGSTLPALLGLNNNVTGTPAIMGADVTGNDNSVCYACHASGSGGTYSFETSGYPSTGPWTGELTYDVSWDSTTHAGNGHLNAEWPGKTYAPGDCKNCHDVHGTANDYDQLRTEDEVGTEGVYGFSESDLTLCFNCHDGTPAGDIKRFYPQAVGGSAEQTETTRFGHRTWTSGNLSAGSALPCYDCHNPHGATASYGLTVVTETATDTPLTLGDAAGEINMAPGRGSADVRRFCLSCHVTYDASASGWNGSAMATVSHGAKVEGLQRDGSDGSKLRLPEATGHNLTDGTSCYGCHGNDYAVGGNNVHNPTKPSVTNPVGGQECYQCHSAMQANMEDGTGSKVGADRTDSYHHVMGGNYDGGSYVDGDFGPGPSGTYNSTGKTEVFCVSCHVDHDVFNSSRSSNLRTYFGGSGSVVATNTDYSDSLTSGGVCTSCHATTLAKDVNNQKSAANANSSDASTRTPVVGSAGFTDSAHQYPVSSTFGDSTSFKGNCVKCHNDENIGEYKQYQTSSTKFGPHFSSMRRILSAFGATPEDPIDEYNCFGCHAPQGSFSGAKSFAGKDWYNSASMTALAEKVFIEFNSLTGSRHPILNEGGNQLTCANCHNPHVVTPTSRVVEPDNTYNLAPYSTPEEQATYCLRCHDSSQPLYRSDDTTYVPQTVIVDGADAEIMDKTTNAVRGHWTPNGSIGSGEIVPCASCHDNHGSNAPKLLGEFTYSDNSSRINNRVITANDSTVCFACHELASTSFPATETAREAGTGYLYSGTWPGQARYTTSYDSFTHTGNGHLNATWPGTSYGSGDCKNCHNVHGTGNTYDALRSGDASGTYAYSDASFTVCFRCHGDEAGSPGFATTNIEQYYPAAAGGTGTGSRAGHRVKSDIAGATLSQGQAMPCYNCHNPHGSRAQYSLQVRDIGDNDGEIDVSDASGVREFCFTCHSTADTAVGWTGSGYAAVGVTTVEGIRRDGSDGSVLKLPNETGHKSTDGQSCYQCHLNDDDQQPAQSVLGRVSGRSGLLRLPHRLSDLYGRRHRHEPGREPRRQVPPRARWHDQLDLLRRRQGVRGRLVSRPSRARSSA